MGKKNSSFFVECFNELKKVEWPSKESVASSAKVVLISTVIMAAFFGLVDFALNKGLVLIF